MAEALFRVWRIGLPTHGGIQETGFRGTKPRPLHTVYPVHCHQVRSRIGMAAQHWTDGERRVRILTKVGQKEAWSLAKGLFCVTVTTHPPQQGRFLPALAAPAASPRRLTSKRRPDSFPHWLALDTAILAPTNCGWGSLGWRGRRSGCMCCRAPSLFPLTIDDVSEGLGP